MNIQQEYINRRARVIKRMEALGPEHFNMDTWYRYGPEPVQQVGAVRDLGKVRSVTGRKLGDCGTSACLAGTAAWEFLGEEYFESHYEIGEYLGISSMVFMPSNWREDYDINTLRSLQEDIQSYTDSADQLEWIHHTYHDHRYMRRPEGVDVTPEETKVAEHETIIDFLHHMNLLSEESMDDATVS